MFDVYLNKLCRKPLQNIARFVSNKGLSANAVTVSNIPVNISIFFCIWAKWYGLAIVLILLSRFLDGLDGAIARERHSSHPASGYLDIMVDYIFYISIPLGFVVADSHNAVAGAFVLAAYTFTGVNFMASAAAAAKLHLRSYAFPNKALYYATNIVEGAETIVYSLVVCIVPQFFVAISTGYAIILFITTPIILYFRWKEFLKSPYYPHLMEHIE